MEAFDDRRLINVARYHYFSGKRDGELPEQFNGVEDLFQKEKLTNPERNTLLELIETSKYVKPLSMNDMKNEIFALIGASPQASNAYTNTCNRAELEVIYNYIKSVAKPSVKKK